jgi:hypothetical protein
MVPGTGNATLDLVLEVGVVIALVLTLLLLIRNYRGR